MSRAASYCSCSYFYWHGCVAFYQLNPQMEMALATCSEQRPRAAPGPAVPAPQPRVTRPPEAPERESFLQILSPPRACSSQAASCLGFHSIFLAFGFQDYKPTYNPSSHSCFQRKKNTVKRSHPISGRFSKQKRKAAAGAARSALAAGSAPARAPGPRSPGAPASRAGKCLPHLHKRRVRRSNGKFLRTKWGCWGSELPGAPFKQLCKCWFCLEIQWRGRSPRDQPWEPALAPLPRPGERRITGTRLCTSLGVSLISIDLEQCASNGLI